MIKKILLGFGKRKNIDIKTVTKSTAKSDNKRIQYIYFDREWIFCKLYLSVISYSIASFSHPPSASVGCPSPVSGNLKDSWFKTIKNDEPIENQRK